MSDRIHKHIIFDNQDRNENMKAFIGLGNPTSKYENTRHNIGFMDVDFLVEKLGLQREWKEKFESLYIEARVNGEKVLFVKPQTYMNNSGRSVRKWVDYYDIAIEDIYVFYDDMDIPFGNLKLKIGGSAGGHNGVSSLIQQLGSQDFNRIRLGIDRPPRDLMIDYVLRKFSKHELAVIETELFPKTETLFNGIFEKPFRDLMAVYNKKRS